MCNMHGICTKNVTNMQKNVNYYAHNMQEICKKYAGKMTNMQSICNKYANMQVICKLYASNILTQGFSIFVERLF